MIRPRHVLIGMGLAYVGLLAWGWLAVNGRGPAAWTRRDAAVWVAARDLPALWQLDSVDLVVAGDTVDKAVPDLAKLTGQHLSAPKRKGAPVSAADVGPLSVGTPLPGTVRFVFATRADNAPALALARPGERLAPCVASAGREGAPATWDCNAAPFTVIALHRTGAARDSLWAVMEAPTAEAAAGFTGASGRLLVRRPR